MQKIKTKLVTAYVRAYRLYGNTGDLGVTCVRGEMKLKTIREKGKGKIKIKIK